MGNGLELNNKNVMDHLLKTINGLNYRKNSIADNVNINSVGGNKDFQYINGNVRLGNGYVGGNISNNKFSGPTINEYVAGKKLNDNIDVSGFYQPKGGTYGGKRLGVNINYKY